MEDGKTVALRRTYVPNSFRILLSAKDFAKIEPIEEKLIEELEVFIAETAKQRDWDVASTPSISFVMGPKLRTGEFRVEAAAVNLSKKRDKDLFVDKRAPARTGAPVLVLLDEMSSVVKTVTVGASVVIGRQEDCEFVLPDRTISRRHAEIVDSSGNGMYLLRDLGSRNGTIVNGREVKEHRLRDRDRIVIGGSVLEFRRA